ncbi:MAG: hypothetical protein MPEBLZ_03248 [Candidatus Methanoperedens nitroreducens]|uniref:Uncharacterized protein n=1 Tax=Candidatus Methanoperedens nitratireducens TaxID=1392998 RepID=A0A0P8C642_9EURY|nr:MAG: hypothetical protein MPEBLZ_03248 [Candidatus Methanoperedens sp. BLZ1]
MCNIQAKYFAKNGSSDWGNCSAVQNDTINAEAVVTFSGAEIGKQYKCELKIKLPIEHGGAEFSFFTPLRTVYGTETFTAEAFKKPVPTGNYQMVWVTVYDENGNTVCQG